MNKIIILLGQRVRSGTNFIGSVMSQHPDVVTIPPTTSLGELNLFRQRTIENKVFDEIKAFGFGLNLEEKDKAAFMESYGNLWIKLLEKKFSLDSTKTIFIKSFVIENIDLWLKAFPQAKIVLLSRDGRDNIISSIRASNDYRQWHTPILKLKKRFNYFSGRSFINHIKHWSYTARIILDTKESENLVKFKYEDLVNSKQGIAQLLDFYGLRTDETILDNCLNAPIMGSSFGVNQKGEVKPNWSPKTNKSKFTFVGKWKPWGWLKKLIFKRYAGAELKALGYETSDKW